MEKFRNWVRRKSNSIFWSYGVGPFVVTVIPAIVLLYYYMPNVARFFDAYLISKNWRLFIHESPWVPILAILWPWAWTMLLRYFYSWSIDDSQSLNLKETSVLLEVIDYSIIEEKIFRLNDGDSGERLCKNQICHITKAIYFYFHAIYEDVRFSVALAKMGEEFIDDFEEFIPRSEILPCTAEELRHDSCTYSVTKKRKQMMIIPNVLEEGKRSGNKNYLITEGSRDMDGSLLCYPVQIGKNEIPYIISVFAHKKDFFRSRNKSTRKWEIVMQKFASRMKIECLQLKSTSNHGKANR